MSHFWSLANNLTQNKILISSDTKIIISKCERHMMMDNDILKSCSLKLTKSSTVWVLNIYSSPNLLILNPQQFNFNIFTSLP